MFGLRKKKKEQTLENGWEAVSRAVASAPNQLTYKTQDPCKSITPDTHLPSFFTMGLGVGTASAGCV